MVLFCPSPRGLASGGKAEAVGVRYIAATGSNPPMRVYYPAERGRREVGFFQDTTPALFLQGYWAILLGGKRETLLFRMGLRFLEALAWVLPLGYRKVPGVYQDARPIVSSTANKKPLILFSHGLAGTGQENSVLLSAWAKQGHVVVSVHHTDGSSNHVRLADGSILWNTLAPPLTPEEPPRTLKTQIEERVQNLLQAREWMAANYSKDCLVDWESTLVAGLSYGAATAAALAASGRLPSLKAVLLLDGWFHVDIPPAVEFEFPQEAFDEASSTNLKEIPALVLSSEAFCSQTKLWAATTKLASKFKDANPPTVIRNTAHINFCDIIFLFSPFVLKGMSHKELAPDSTDPKQAYADIVQHSVDFWKQQSGQPQ